MIRRKKIVTIIFIIIIIIFLGIGITYAALSTTLNITTNTVKQTSLTWDIGFDTSTNVAFETNINGLGGWCPSGTLTVNSYTISSPMTLKELNDYCAYKLTIINNGTIGAKISSINITPPTDTTCTTNGSTMTCGIVEYSLHYSSVSGTKVAVNDTIAPKSGTTGTKKIVYLVVKLINTPSGDVTQNNFTYSINYSQN